MPSWAACRLLPRQHGVGNGEVGHGGRQRAVHGHAGPVVEPDPGGDDAAPGLEGDQPAGRGGQAEGSHAVVAVRERNAAGGHRRRAATRASGGGPRGVPGVAGDGAGAVGRGVEAELGDVGDAHDDGAGGPQPGDHRMIGRLRHLGGRGRPVGADLPGHRHVVLHRDRHAGQSQGAPVGSGVDGRRLDQRRGPPDDAEGTDAGVDGGDVLQVGADDVDRRELTRPHPRRDLRGRQTDDRSAAQTSASVHAWTVTTPSDSHDGRPP
jgi:hypothetical protein